MALRGNPFDLVLLPVLLLLFAVVQARQPLRQYRLWMAAWVGVMLGYVFWMPVVSGAEATFLESLRLMCLVCGLMTFIASMLLKDGPLPTTVAKLSTVLALPCLAVLLTVSGVHANAALLPCIVAGQACAAYMAVTHMRGRQSLPWVVLLCGLSTAVMIAYQVRGDSNSLSTWILVQELLTCVTLLLLSDSRRYAGAWISAAGFAAWAITYMSSQTLYQHPHLMSVMAQVWNTPKHLVGLGMILMVLEADTAKIQGLSEEYRLLYESNPQPMWIFDLETARFLSVNDSAVKHYGYTRKEFLSMTLFDIRPEDDHEALTRLLKEGALEDRRAWRHRRRDGTVFETYSTGHDVLFGGRKARFIMAMDITEQENINRELVYRAQHDPLTGLANRMLLEDRAQQMLARASRDGSKVALLTMDADRFKQINDTYGHMIGDECLKGIATRLELRVRDADTLARTGGEEFTALIGGLTSARAAQAAGGALLGALNAPLTLSSNSIALTMSMGIALFPDDGDTLELLRQRSDSAMYRAKRAGGNCIVMANEDASLDATSAVDLESALRNAISESTLELFYQPIYDNRGVLARVEALVRGTDHYLRKAGPGVFIPIAEESGLILPLGNWVLEEACRQVTEWRAANVPEFELAVNVSARQLVQLDFADRVLSTLERNHLPAQSLHLELTETTLMRDFSSMVRSMQRLSEAGVRFSIDDFGTGYSSLARLSELPISTIKIDRSFVLKLTDSDAAVGIVRAIVHMSRHLKLEIVAEGVEEEEHIRILRDLGCDLFQGFYLAKPLAPNMLKETAMRDGGVLPPFRDSAAARLSGSHSVARPLSPTVAGPRS